MKSYHAIYEREENGWWTVSVREVPGCHTQGRSLKQARERIFEALDLFDVSIAPEQLKDEIQLPATLKKQLERVQESRAEVARLEKEAAKMTQRVAQTLVKKGRLSLRDVGAVMNLSHQRVQQLMRRAYSKDLLR